MSEEKEIQTLPTPQVISGNRSKDSLHQLVSHLVHSGIANIVVQKGCYDFGDPLTNIAEAHKNVFGMQNGKSGNFALYSKMMFFSCILKHTNIL